MPRPIVTTTCALWLAIAALTGCGGESPAEGGASAASAKTADPCELLTSADAQDVLEAAPQPAVRQDNAALRMCQYSVAPSGDGLEAVAGAPTASVSVFQAEASRAMLESNTAGGTPVEGVGEAAAELGTAIYFLKGERLYAVDLFGDGMTDSSRAALAKRIADRVPASS